MLNGPMTEACCEKPMQVIPNSLSERLKLEKHRTAERLQKIEDALALLSKNPEMQKLLDSITDLRLY